MERVQTKLVKEIGRRTRGLAGRDSQDTERPFLVKFTRWVCEGMINGGEGMRGSNALLSGFGQGLTKYS